GGAAAPVRPRGRRGARRRPRARDRRPRRAPHDGARRRVEHRGGHARARGVKPARRRVVLDLGGVVCRFDPAARLRALTDLSGMDADAIDAAIWGSGLDAAAERGEIDPSTLRVLVAGALGGRVDTAAIRTAWSYAFAPDPEVLALVDHLTVPAVLFT